MRTGKNRQKVLNQQVIIAANIYLNEEDTRYAKQDRNRFISEVHKYQKALNELLNIVVIIFNAGIIVIPTES